MPDQIKFADIKERLHPSFSEYFLDNCILEKTHNQNPYQLLFNNKRFDLISKYLLIKAIDNQYDTDWFQEHYFATINAFNGFNEENREKLKSGQDEFLSNFTSLYNDIKHNGYDEDKGLIPVNQNGVLIDGAHRLAICAFLNIPVTTVELVADTNFDYNFFNSRNLNTEHSDYIALNYCLLNQNARIAILYPVANIEFDNQVEKIFQEHSGIYYKRSIFLKSNAPHFLTKEFYHGHDWIGNIEDKFLGSLNKAKACFSGSNPLRIIIYESNGENVDIVIKQRIRDIFSISNHSIHSTDNHEETIRCAQLLLNSNNLHHLSHLEIKNMKNFESLFCLLQSTFNNNKNAIVLDGSSTLAAYGIRDVADIDYISRSDEKFEGIDYINSHTETLVYHKKNPDELIYNPENYFYFKGFKLISLYQLAKMKKRRNEQKDIADLILMKPFLKGRITLKLKRKLEFLAYKYWDMFKLALKKILPNIILNLIRKNDH